jgi:8-oxo-dGTP diphosphatase
VPANQRHLTRRSLGSRGIASQTSRSAPEITSAPRLKSHMRPVECVAFMLIQSNHVLAEQRKHTKEVMPGAVALPGGHVEAEERPDEALRREIREELGIVPIDVVYVCTLLHRSQEFRKLHYFAVTRWQGEMQLHEAEALLWIPLSALSCLDLDVDRTAVAEYVRVYTP